MNDLIVYRVLLLTATHMSSLNSLACHVDPFAVVTRLVHHLLGSLLFVLFCRTKKTNNNKEQMKTEREKKKNKQQQHEKMSDRERRKREEKKTTPLSRPPLHTRMNGKTTIEKRREEEREEKKKEMTGGGDPPTCLFVKRSGPDTSPLPRGWIYPSDRPSKNTCFGNSKSYLSCLSNVFTAINNVDLTMLMFVY
jgi:hypothetical protein